MKRKLFALFVAGTALLQACKRDESAKPATPSTVESRKGCVIQAMRNSEEYNPTTAQVLHSQEGI